MTRLEQMKAAAAKKVTPTPKPPFVAKKPKVDKEKPKKESPSRKIRDAQEVVQFKCGHIVGVAHFGQIPCQACQKPKGLFSSRNGALRDKGLKWFPIGRLPNGTTKFIKWEMGYWSGVMIVPKVEVEFKVEKAASEVQCVRELHEMFMAWLETNNSPDILGVNGTAE